jgi:hypothetical protein
MAGAALTLASVLMCPHGGTVQALGEPSKAMARGAPLLSSAASYTITGCPFQLPGPTPSPCLSVEWLLTDSSVKVSGAPTLSTSSVGLCKAASGAPQGTVVVAYAAPGMSTR